MNIILLVIWVILLLWVIIIRVWLYFLDIDFNIFIILLDVLEFRFLVGLLVSIIVGFVVNVFVIVIFCCWLFDNVFGKMLCLFLSFNDFKSFFIKDLFIFLLFKLIGNIIFFYILRDGIKL